MSIHNPATFYQTIAVLEVAALVIIAGTLLSIANSLRKRNK